MTRPDHDSPHDHAAFIARLRGAVDPGLAPGAAARIADGAWQRTRDGASAPPGRRLPRRPLRWAAAAAVLLAVATGTYVVSRPSDAFAVEGEPVRVWNDDAWTASSSVRGDATVFAPAGTHALRARNGSLIQPTAGALFRLEPSEGQRFVVRVLRGSVEVSGPALRLDVGDLFARSAEGDQHLALVAQLLSDQPTTLAPPRQPFATIGAVPQIEVRAGSAFVQSVKTREERRLGVNDIITLGSNAQFVDVTRWDEDMAHQMMLGALTVDADTTPLGDMQLRLQVNGDEIVTLVPKTDMRRVLSFVNFVTFENAVRLPAQANVHVAILGAVVGETAEFEHELIREKDGRTSALRVFVDGRVELEDGDHTRRFPSLEAARTEAPDALSLFEGYLDELD